MKKETGGPAFPTENEHQTGNHTFHYEGLSMRDYFAVHASDADVAKQAEVIRMEVIKQNGIGVLPDGWRVTARYMHADQMLKAREA